MIPAISIPILCKLEVPVLTVVSSITTVPVPTERIPVTLASPFTIKSVVAPPTTTSPIVVTPDILTLSKFVCPSTSKSTKSPVAAVTIPTIETPAPT